MVRSKRMKEAGYEEYIFMPLLMRPRQGVAGDFEILKYKAETLNKQWRDEDHMEPTGEVVTTAKLKSANLPFLFSGVSGSLGDLDARIEGGERAPTPTAEEGDEDNQYLYKNEHKISKQREMLERQLRVMQCRQVLNYGTGMVIGEPNDDTLALINEKIAGLFSCSHTSSVKTLNKEEVHVWAFPEMPLDTANKLLFKEKITEHVSNSNRLLELLNWAPGSDFVKYLGGEDAAAAQLLRCIVLGGVGPLEKTNPHGVTVWQMVSVRGVCSACP